MLAALDDAGEFGERAVFLSASSLEPGSPLGVTQLAARGRLGPYEIIAALERQPLVAPNRGALFAIVKPDPTVDRLRAAMMQRGWPGFADPHSGGRFDEEPA
jgi:hypothetical protein